MDCLMPEMDGFEATAAIRGMDSETTRSIPIIALTASTMEQDRQRCLNAGMDGHVSKPVHPKELYDAIKDHLTGSS
jgi:CheY-like chemotaxis protein